MEVRREALLALVALSQWQDKQSKPAFEKAAESQSVRLQRAGKAALERLEEENSKQSLERLTSG